MASSLKGTPNVRVACGRWRAGCVLALTLAIAAPGAAYAPADGQAVRPTFRSGVEVVTISAVVRDRKGRFVPGLTREDFEIIDRGLTRRIGECRSDQAALSLALLVDVSGSMAVGGNLARARSAADLVLAGLERGRDEAALFTFDTGLREVRPFTTDPRAVLDGFDTAIAFGATRLHDAIAATAQRVVSRGSHRRAILVLTDGVDNASTLSPAEVSGIASEIDVPVYIVTVVTPMDQASADEVLNPTSAAAARAEGTLGDLARWTGGAVYVTSAADEQGAAAREIVAALRHQYLLSFEPGGPAGWHPLVVRTRQKNLVVHTRGGYVAGPAGSDH